MIYIDIKDISELDAEVNKLPKRREPNNAEKELINALRSGKYEQTRRVLKQNNAYCCLGVACDVYNTTLWKEDNTFLGNAYRLPNEVRDGLDWEDYAGSLHITLNLTRSYCHLTHLNDKGASFSTIANVIEKGYVVLAND